MSEMLARHDETTGILWREDEFEMGVKSNPPSIKSL